MRKILILICMLFLLEPLKVTAQTPGNNGPGSCAPPVHPKLVTDMTPHDTDDPAIWIHPLDYRKSLILGTDKNKDGGLYVFDLKGRIIKGKTVLHLQRPNNVDVEYGLRLAGENIDIAVVTERLTHRLRVFRLPDMTPVDGGGLEVFQGETGEEQRALMGISLYRRPKDGAVFAVVGRKKRPFGKLSLAVFAAR